MRRHAIDGDVRVRPVSRWLVAVLLLTGCGAPPVAAPPSAPPTVPDGAVFRPAFQTTQGPVEAGTAFVVAWQNRQILLSALHLLGPAGGLPQDVPAATVPQLVTQVSLGSCFPAATTLNLSFPADTIPIIDAKPLGEISTGAGDIIAFWMPVDAKSVPLTLADSVPATGARVWLAAEVISGAEPGARLHPATVIEVDQAGDFLYAFDNSKLELQATSGAPVLDAQGRVVAIHLGGGNPQGKLLGVGNPVSRFRPYLLKAKSPSRALAP